MRNDLNIDEIFIPYSFEEWNMKHMDTKKIYILNLLLNTLDFKRKTIQDFRLDGLIYQLCLTHLY